jgi:hypothetical protein
MTTAWSMALLLSWGGISTAITTFVSAPSPAQTADSLTSVAVLRRVEQFRHCNVVFHCAPEL